MSGQDTKFLLLSRILVKELLRDIYLEFFKNSIIIIKVKEKSQNSPKFKEIKDMQIMVPSWLEADAEKLEGKVVALPTREEIDTPIQEHLIVELYSK